MDLYRVLELLMILIQDKGLRAMRFGREACLLYWWGPSAWARGYRQTEGGLPRRDGNELWKTSGDSFGPEGHSTDP
jgi:hypothetical protein